MVRMVMATFGPGHSPSFESTLIAGCAATLVVGCLWLTLTTTWYAVAVLDARRRHAAVVGRCGCPRPIRLAVVALMGLGPSVLALPAYADPGATTPVSAGLTGLPLPDRVIGGSRPPAGDRIVVRTGDTLWDLTRVRLPAAASDAAIDAAWRRLYHANRRTIGADPDLLVPGTVLHEGGRR